jgi:transaldolase/glucose-6-phosphate isomerase
MRHEDILTPPDVGFSIDRAGRGLESARFDRHERCGAHFAHTVLPATDRNDIMDTAAADKVASRPLRDLHELGQSIWLDYIRRHLITSGELQQLVDSSNVTGITANPSIFEKAIVGSTDYADALARIAKSGTCADAKTAYETLAIGDIQDAAEILQPVYDETHGTDGFVSLEVSPLLAHDTQGTIDEARRLWAAIGRKNVMIKVPGTVEGVPAIRQLTDDGINVNITLLFSLGAYEAVAYAYLEGLEARLARGDAIGHIASVASFFVSRIDTAVDTLIGNRLNEVSDVEERAQLRALQGRVAIANAKLAYQWYEHFVETGRWAQVADKGAHPQRLLWASTSTKNPQYRDVLYVEELIGPDTIDTMTPATLDAFRDHGHPRVTLTEDVAQAHETMAALSRAGISIDAVTARLLDDGIRLFADAFGKLLDAVDRKLAALRPHVQDRMTNRLPGLLAGEVSRSLSDWQARSNVHKLWARDATLWTGRDEGRWLGWLGITDDQLAHLEQLRGIADDVRHAAFTDAVLLGMGGSSMCAEVLGTTFGRQNGFPALHVLDSTDPQQIRTLTERLDLPRTLFIVSSKSGSTLEPNILCGYFFDRMQQSLGGDPAGRRFMAITDPGSPLHQLADARRFRHICFGVPSIGGRYSALSNFGMVPAAVMGLDVARFLDRADEMVHSCASCVPAAENPGAILGNILGVLARHGRDKVTIAASPAIAALGGWLEQLLAESTGKSGRGLIPIDGERLGSPDVYGDDRVFVYIRLDSNPDPDQEEAIANLERANHPVVRIAVADPYDLGQEFFRWEIATAVAGAVLGINPFDQPDVEASKVLTKRLLAEYETKKSLPVEEPFLREGRLVFYAGPARGVGSAASIGNIEAVERLKAHFDRLKTNGYFALLAYVAMSDEHRTALQAIRHVVRDRKRVATCLGFGPRFLHSTGQAHKGGPNSGVFLQITCDDAVDIPVPGEKYTFGIVKAAQARGDFTVLADRDRQILRVHLGSDVAAGLKSLHQLVAAALS